MRWMLLLALSATACKPAHACKPAGGVLFEVAQRTTKGVKRITATTWLYEDGAWRTDVTNVDGRVVHLDGGCLAPAELDAIRAELAHAPWKTTKTDRLCRTDQPRFTQYIWKGRVLYTERDCNVLELDPVSRDALDRVTGDLRAPRELDSGVDKVCLDNPLAPGCD